MLKITDKMVEKGGGLIDILKQKPSYVICLDNNDSHFVRGGRYEVGIGGAIGEYGRERCGSIAKFITQDWYDELIKEEEIAYSVELTAQELEYVRGILEHIVLNSSDQIDLNPISVLRKIEDISNTLRRKEELKTDLQQAQAKVEEIKQQLKQLD